jgi:transglutaminase/protease-like cytokinesis protein 3
MDLCIQVNLKVKYISGYAKGYGYKYGEKSKAPNHAWNLIELNGK